MLLTFFTFLLNSGANERDAIILTLWVAILKYKILIGQLTLIGDLPG